MQKEATDDLVRKIDRVTAVLTDMPAAELGHSWDERGVANWLKMFGDLRALVIAGKRPKFVGYLRGLDGCGPVCQELFKAVLDVEVAINKRQ